MNTDGSQAKGNPTLGEGVVNPKTNSITHINMKSQPERHTINRAELAKKTPQTILALSQTTNSASTHYATTQ